MMMPMKNADNAGAKTLYYYLQKLSEQPDISVFLIAKAQNDKEFNNSIPNVTIFPVCNLKITSLSFIDLINDINSKLNPFHFLGNTVRESIYKQIINKLSQLDIVPDCVIIEFFQMLPLVDKIKNIYPSTRIISSEHDVGFLWYERNAMISKWHLGKLYKKVIANKIKNEELGQLHKCDLIMPHNYKDADLLIQNGIADNKINVLVPNYYHIECNRDSVINSIIFYGAMNRPENYESAIWFINNVFGRLSGEFKFLIIGSNPDEKLQKYQSDRIIITGFVENITSYFSNCLCLVAPLTLGAGIKVKVLEAMCAGVPTLTNDIGIEGIPAVNGRDYIHCVTADDYYLQIKKLALDNEYSKHISVNAKKLIADKFNMAQSFEKYLKNIKGIDCKEDHNQCR